MNSTFRLVVNATLIVLGIIIPIVFHFIGAMGQIFLPMHITVFIAGLLLGPGAGCVTGILTPLLNTYLTGMPPIMPILPIMITELAIYGSVSGYLYRNRHGSLFASLLIAMLLGRVGAILAAYSLIGLFNIDLEPTSFILGAFVTGLPGLVIQFIIVPVLVTKLNLIFYLKLQTKQ